MLCNQGMTKLEGSNEMDVANELGAVSNFFAWPYDGREDSCRL